MIGRIIVAIVIGVVAFLLCLLGGAVLGDLKISVLTTIGDFLKQWAVVIGVVVAVLAFFSGWNPLGGRAA